MYLSVDIHVYIFVYEISRGCVCSMKSLRNGAQCECLRIGKVVPFLVLSAVGVASASSYCSSFRPLGKLFQSLFALHSDNDDVAVYG